MVAHLSEVQRPCRNRRFAVGKPIVAYCTNFKVTKSHGGRFPSYSSFVNCRCPSFSNFVSCRSLSFNNDGRRPCNSSFYGRVVVLASSYSSSLAVVVLFVAVLLMVAP